MEIKEIEQIVNKFFLENTMDDTYFVDAKISGKKIEVFIDKDGGISFDICKKISRVLEEIFDERKSFGEDYTLDVSSPGVGSPLKLPRQYFNNIGRQIEIKSADRKWQGMLKAADDTTCTIELEQVTLDGKKKIKELVDHVFKYVDISEAKIKISF